MQNNFINLNTYSSFLIINSMKGKIEIMDNEWSDCQFNGRIITLNSASKAQILRNKFVNNSATITFYLSGTEISLIGNVFNNSDVNCDVETQFLNASISPYSAFNNHWISTNFTESKICDFHMDSQKHPLFIDQFDLPENFVSSYGTIGGVLNDTFTLTAERRELLVDRSILIL